jgi:hypothetical protein
MKPTSEDVIAFLHHFESLAEQENFDLISKLIEPSAVFRFSDGDFRGHVAVRAAFEKSWRGNPAVKKSRFYLSEIEVIHVDLASASASYTWNWEGAEGDQKFKIRGRGTRVLRYAAREFTIAHEHLSRFPNPAS